MQTVAGSKRHTTTGHFKMHHFSDETRRRHATNCACHIQMDSPLQQCKTLIESMIFCVVKTDTGAILVLL